ncbi:MAG: DsbA family protein [Pseudomonadaceae bacterium]|nr:DsbA family protein [Pseudomonadaceae bacterium]
MTSIDIYIDFKSPAAYLALAPTRALLARTGIQANWHPFNTRLSSIPEQKLNENKGEKHRRVRALARRDVHLLYAEVQNLPMAFRDQPFDAKLALAVLQTLDNDVDTYIEAAFRAYWQEQKDLDDPKVVAALLKELELNIPVPETQAAEHIVDEAALAAEDQGVIETPGYVFAGQVFIGREHLPWIEELLSADVSA